MTPLRTCTKCGVAKPRTCEFFDARAPAKSQPTCTSPDGLKAICKACRRDMVNARRQANPEQFRACDRRRNKDQKNATTRASYQRHRERRLEDKRRQYAADPVRQLAIKRAWLEGAPERLAHKMERDRAYYKANRERHRAQADVRRATAMGAGGWWTEEDIAHMHAAQDRRCYYCDRPLTEGYEIDHRIPLSRTELNPSNWPENLCLACRQCNRRKHNKTEAEFIRLNGGRFVQWA